MIKYTDPLTKQLFVPKRKNQRFASRQNQIEYNNMIARTQRLAMKKIDMILKHNRKVLWRLLGEKPEYVVRKMRLISLGFDFNHYTHHVLVNEEKKKYALGIYDFMLENILNDNYKITRYATI